ncbi:MAG: hypothetical protein KZQ57_06255 [gamma proteobacterium symbiont of Lucinoma myriamae]|nr:hypothetical protein [gamma proteobacterium symbiont of Lucinoma myriamae]
MGNNLSRTVVFFLFFLFSLTVTAEDTTFTTAHFSGSGNCSMCHYGLVDTSGDNVSIVRDWGASMMANATKDPFWRAKVATELERNPHLSSIINDKCSKCHAPMANYEINKVQGGEMSLFGPDGILNPSHDFYDAGMNGVSCTVCHQIDDVNLGTLAGSSGQYSINNNKIIYGQFSDIFAQPMINNTGYMPAYSAHISDSALCASCHDLKTPYVDSVGVIIPQTEEDYFPEQMSYTEWQNSEFDDSGTNPQSCQDCHMPKTTSKVSSRPMWLDTKDGFAKHHLVGANTTMLTLLKNNATELDVISNNMDLSINRARNMLKSSVSIEIISASVNNGELEAHVKLVNNSGHKTPTAYPSRRMWLHFKVTDSNNNIVFESGKIDPDGAIAGADNDLDQSLVEQHHDVITSEDQVQIYETIMGNTDGEVTFTLLRSAQYLKDNRLTPKGFDKSNVPSDVAVIGLAFDDPDFNNGGDELSYRISGLAAGVFNVSISLNYQTISHGFLQDLYADNNQLEQVLDFKRMYNAQTLKHETIVSTETNVISDGGGTTPLEPTLNLSVSPSTIEQGSSATLSWNTTDVTTCIASGAWSADIGTSGTHEVTPEVTSTYTLSCTGDGGTITDSVTITVTPPVVNEPLPTVNFVASPSRIARGETITLNWSSTDAVDCSATDGWSGTKGSSGSQSITLYEPSTFTLTCNGKGGSVSSSIVYGARGRKWLGIK